MTDKFEIDPGPRIKEDASIPEAILAYQGLTINYIQVIHNDLIDLMEVLKCLK